MRTVFDPIRNKPQKSHQEVSHGRELFGKQFSYSGKISNGVNLAKKKKEIEELRKELNDLSELGQESGLK